VFSTHLRHGRLAGPIAVATLSRLVLNVGQRMAYPFLPVIARGLDVSLASASLLVSAGLVTGLAGPLIGPLADRAGRRRMMAWGMLLFSAGAALAAAYANFATVAAGFLIIGLGKVFFDPSLRAFVGDRVPFERRGVVLAFTELAWAGAILVGVPFAGWVMEARGWRAGYAGVAAAGLVGLTSLLVAIPADSPAATSRQERDGFGRALRSVLTNRAALGALGITWLLMASHELLFVVYGAWMETSHGLSVAQIGLVSMVIGVAELVGELGAAGLVDRLGKGRSLAIGLLLTGACYLVLPFLSAHLAASLAGLFALYVCFEFTFVATLPLLTELVPGARATIMSINGAWDSLGRVSGTLLGPILWAAGGMWVNGAVAGAATLAALLVLKTVVRPAPQST